MAAQRDKAAEPLMIENKGCTSKDTNILEKDTNSNPEKNKKNIRRTKSFLCGSVILNIFLVVLVAITIYYMTCNSRGIRRESDLCMNCSHLKVHPDDDLSMFDIYEGNICCVKDGGNYSSMADKLVERNLKENLVSESRQYHPLHCRPGDRASPVIKLVGKLKNYPDPDQSTRFSWLKWDVGVQTSNEAGQEQLNQLNDTFILVGSTGIYQIYSQIVLHNKKSEEPSAYSTSSNKYYVHAIYRQSRSGYTERLLGGSYTYYQNKDGESAITSYIGSPYQLLKGDTIGVKVHDISQVVPSDVTNFFGMHLIQ